MLLQEVREVYFKLTGNYPKRKDNGNKNGAAPQQAAAVPATPPPAPAPPSTPPPPVPAVPAIPPRTPNSAIRAAMAVAPDGMLSDALEIVNRLIEGRHIPTENVPKKAERANGQGFRDLRCLEVRIWQ